MKHLHHIVPRHVGGTDDATNLVEVTVEQHAELHLELYLKHGHRADWIAYHCLSGQIVSEEKERQMVELRKEKFKEWRKANPHSEETKAKISASNKGKNKGRKVSAEARRKQSEKLKGRAPVNRKPVTIDGIEFVSVTAAARHLGISQQALSARLKRSK